MSASHDISQTSDLASDLASDLVAGPKPVGSAVRGSKPSVFDRFSTPLWIAIGISVVALAVLAAFS